MIRKYTFVGAIMMVCATSAFASCEKPESLFESKDCLRIDLQRANKAVRQAYRSAVSFLQHNGDIDTKNALKALSDSQKAWFIYRKKDCGLYSVLHEGDNNASQNEMACEIEHAKLRIARLKELSQ